MADLEAVLADVSYLMAMEKSKCTPAARASKKIVLPDPRYVRFDAARFPAVVCAVRYGGRRSARPPARPPVHPSVVPPEDLSPFPASPFFFLVYIFHIFLLGCLVLRNPVREAPDLPIAETRERRDSSRVLRMERKKCLQTTALMTPRESRHGFTIVVIWSVLLRIPNSGFLQWSLQISRDAKNSTQNLRGYQYC